jgi:putative transposase
MGKEQPTTPHLLKRAFNPTDLNTRWVGDITYIRSHQGWSYLATVMDLANREIVGYAMSKTPDAKLAKKALTNAIATHQPNTKGLMFHSDQGVQYNAKLFKETLHGHKMIQSMSRRGNCWDNAVQERFFRNLKTEYLNDLTFINHQSVVAAVERYIGFYNYKRLNSAIDYLTPAQKRQELLKVA